LLDLGSAARAACPPSASRDQEARREFRIAPGLNGPLQYEPRRAIDSFEFLPAQTGRGPVGPYCGGVQNLVGVDVPNARNPALVHEERLDPPRWTSGYLLFEVRKAEVLTKRFRAHTIYCGYV